MTRLIQEGPYTVCFNRYYSALVDSGSVINTYLIAQDDLSTALRSSGCLLHMNDELSPAP